MLLTDDGRLAHALTDPRFKLPKTYFVQVENIPDTAALQKLRRGVPVKGVFTAPAEIELLRDRAGTAAARRARPRATGHPHRLAEDHPARRQEAPDPPHDRGRRPPDAAPRARGHRPVDGAWSGAGPVARSDRARTGSCGGPWVGWSGNKVTGGRDLWGDSPE